MRYAIAQWPVAGGIVVSIVLLTRRGEAHALAHALAGNEMPTIRPTSHLVKRAWTVGSTCAGPSSDTLLGLWNKAAQRMREMDRRAA